MKQIQTMEVLTKTQDEADKRLQKEIDRLKVKYDGSNGLPKFDEKEIIEELFNIIGDLEMVYKVKHKLF